MSRNMALGTNCVLTFTLGLRNVTELVTELAAFRWVGNQPLRESVTEVNHIILGTKHPQLRHDGV